MFHQVPVLPVVVPAAAAALAVLVLHLRRRGRLTAPRAAVAVALCVYVGGVLANTVFPIFLDKPASDAPWHSHLALLPLAGYEVSDAVMNTSVFLPLGMLLPLLVARPSWRRTVATAAVFSLGIEVTQLVAARLWAGGHVADVDDLLFNVLGATLGHALLVGLVRVPRVAASVDRFRWHGPPAAPRYAPSSMRRSRQ